MRINPEIVRLGSAASEIYRQFESRAAIFYTRRWSPFDNFSAFTVRIGGKDYPTAEHAYQSWAKYSYSPWYPACETLAELIRFAPSPHEAKKLGGDPTHSYLIRPDFKNVKRALMKTILRAKWEQHEYVRKKLRESGEMIIIEDSPVDDYWGRGPEWLGENTLGELWMEIRSETA